MSKYSRKSTALKESSDFSLLQPKSVYPSKSVKHPLVVGGKYKRVVDVAAAAVFITLASPVLLAIAVAVKVCDGGPIFFKHRRVGFGGQPFDCLKFRTMKVDAEARLTKWLRDNPAAADEWKATQKLKRDPRLTPIGQSLRRSSIDELPQLFNVLRGDMSLVGPRPVVAEELPRYGRQIAHYYAARPGLTGAWQVSGRNDVSYAQRVWLDTEYCMSWSLTNDLLIMLKTVPVLFSGRGSY